MKLTVREVLIPRQKFYMIEIEELFNSYQIAFSEFNSELLAVFYDFPSIIAMPDNLFSFDDHEALKTYLDKMKDFYQSHSVTQAMILKLQITEKSPFFAQAHLNWGLYDSDFQEVVKFDASYTLRQNSNRWKIICVTTHNEMEEFAELNSIIAL